MMGTGIGAKNGILIKSAQALQIVHTADALIFDKTGTLTKGKPELTDVIVKGDLGEEQLLEIAAFLEKRSEHPLGEAIISGAVARGISVGDPESFESVTGKGVRGRVNGMDIVLGNRAMVQASGADLKPFEADMSALEEEGKTVMVVLADGAVKGLLAVADTVKEHAPETVRALKAMGLEVIMITGDNRKTGKAIGKQLGIERVLSEVLPEDKSEEVRKLQSEGFKVVMVGDGINDAPALTQADVGLAIGGGTDVAIEAGDVVLIKDDIRDVVTALELSSYAMRKIRQNLFWAFFYNIIGIPIAAGVLYPFTGFTLNPMIAGAAMAFSSVSVVSNSLLMRRFRKRN
jgi:Cu+-exporting ATPase